MDADLVLVVREHDLAPILEQLQILVCLFVGRLVREEVHAHDDVLRGRDDRLAVRGRENVVRAEHEHVRFGLRFHAQRKVHGHLVAVEVGVEAAANERMDADRVAFHEHRLECLDAHSVQRRGAVEQHGVLVDDFFEDVPHGGVAALEHALGALDGVRQAVLLELADDERLEEFERDLLGKAALVELEFRADDDDRTRGVIDALAQQVFAETALLALDHVGERLERTVG